MQNAHQNSCLTYAQPALNCTPYQRFLASNQLKQLGATVLHFSHVNALPFYFCLFPFKAVFTPKLMEGELKKMSESTSQKCNLQGGVGTGAKPLLQILSHGSDSPHDELQSQSHWWSLPACGCLAGLKQQCTFQVKRKIMFFSYLLHKFLRSSTQTSRSMQILC